MKQHDVGFAKSWIHFNLIRNVYNHPILIVILAVSGSCDFSAEKQALQLLRCVLSPRSSWMKYAIRVTILGPCSHMYPMNHEYFFLSISLCFFLFFFVYFFSFFYRIKDLFWL